MGRLCLGAACAAMILAGCVVEEPGQAGPVDPTADAGQPSVTRQPVATGGVLREGVMVNFDGEEFPVQYREYPDGSLVYGGDIKVTRREDGKLSLAKTSAALFPTLKKWPNGRIPYVLSPQLSVDQNIRVKKALAYWKAASKATAPIVFAPKLAGDKNYVEFVPWANPWCQSSMGMVGGRQTIELGTGCDQNSVRHEIGHLVGFNHEHQRYDRDKYVVVNTAEIRPEFQDAYAVEPPSKGQAVGAYDYNSLMHYSSFVGCVENADGECRGFTMLRKDNQAVVGSLGKLTPDDLLGLRALYSNPATEVAIGNVGAGWTVSRTFKVGVTIFLALANPTTGKVEIRSLNPNGTPGDLQHSYQWSTGWDIFRFYTLGADTYLFTLKSAVGTMNVNKMNANGAVGALVQAANWTTGWNTAEFFKEGATTYLFNVKSGAGTMHISRVNANGSIGALVQEATWSSGWTHASVLQTSPTEAVLFTLKSATGNTDINQMNANGTVGPRIARETWTSGWTQARYFSTEGKVFFFAYKASTGGVHISEVNPNGTLGTLRFLDKRFTDYTDMSFHTLGTAGHALMTRANGDWAVHKYGL